VIHPLETDVKNLSVITLRQTPSSSTFIHRCRNLESLIQ